MRTGPRVALLFLALEECVLAQGRDPVPIPARPWWLTALGMLTNAAIVAGAVALIGALRGRWVVKTNKAGGRRPSRTSAIAGVVLGLGALGHALLPRWPPPARDVINDHTFSSGRMPAIDLTLPAGWRLTYGVADGVPDVVTVTPAADGGRGTTMVVQSSQLDENVDVARLASEFATGMESSAAKLAPPTQTVIDGLPATVVTADRSDGAGVTIWIVKRAQRFVSYVYCFAPPAVADACAPLLARVQWHPPGR